jgi:hypothetical protein
VWWDTQVSSPVTILSRKSAGSWIDMAILNTHCKHNIAVTVVGELCPVIRFLSHMAALPFLKKKIPLHFYWTCIFTFRLSLVHLNSIFWDITLCSTLKANRHFGGLCCLHLQGQRISQARN